MGYDTKPLVTLTEKEKFLNEAADREYIIFLNMIIITSVVQFKKLKEELG